MPKSSQKAAWLATTVFRGGRAVACMIFKKNPRPAGGFSPGSGGGLPDLHLHAEPGDEPDEQERGEARDDEEEPGKPRALLPGGEADDDAEDQRGDEADARQAGSQGLPGVEG